MARMKLASIEQLETRSQPLINYWTRVLECTNQNLFPPMRKQVEISLPLAIGKGFQFGITRAIERESNLHQRIRWTLNRSKLMGKGIAMLPEIGIGVCQGTQASPTHENRTTDGQLYIGEKHFPNWSYRSWGGGVGSFRRLRSNKTIHASKRSVASQARRKINKASIRINYITHRFAFLEQTSEQNEIIERYIRELTVLKTWFDKWLKRQKLQDFPTTPLPESEERWNLFPPPQGE